MRPHRIFDTSMGIVSVVHGDVTVAVAKLGRGNVRSSGIVVAGSRGSGRTRVDRDSAMELIVFVSGRRRGLLRSIVSGHLAGTVMSPRSAGRGGVWVRLPLGIHGFYCLGGLRQQRNDNTSATLRMGGQRELEAGAGGVPAAAAASGAAMSRERIVVAVVVERRRREGESESACGGG